MSALNIPENQIPNLDELQKWITENIDSDNKGKKKSADPKAALAQLSQVLGEVLEQINPASQGKANSNSKIVPLKSHDPAPSAPSAPSNAQMQQAIGALMEILTELEGEIAKYNNQNAQANSSIGQSLIKEMSAQLQAANEQLQKIAKEESQSNFWSIFGKICEGILAAVIAGIAVICGQPELAVIVVAFAILSISPAMNKITQGLSDELSKALVAMGVPKDKADIIAKVVADVIIIAASIAVTVATCGAGSGAVVEEVAEDGIEMTDQVETAVESTTETTQTVSEESQNVFSKIGNFLKENNPFSKLSKTANLGILSGSQALSSTNFGTDFMSLVLVNTKDGATKEELKTILGMIINLLASLVGAGAGTAMVAGPATGMLNNANYGQILKVLFGLQLAGGLTEAGGQIGSGVAYSELASATASQGESQGILSLLQALVRENSQQSSADSKALSSKMKTWATDLSTLSRDLNLTGAAVARELQG